MTGRQRVAAALEGGPVDRMPVAALYDFLYHLDHFAELTRRPQWRAHQWLTASPEEHVATLKLILEAVPFDAVQPQYCPPREVRENTEFFEKDGRVFRRHAGRAEPLTVRTASGHATDYRANETQQVFDASDVDRLVKVTKAEDAIAAGCNDYVEAAVAALGQEHFIVSGGVVGMIYACGHWLGQTNLLMMLIDNPALVDYLSGKLLEENIERIRQYAAAGGDGIYIDDATATSDVISVAHYERFSLPHVTQMVREIHRLGRKAILIYFGGVMDRLEQIASIGADGLCVEASMKGYVNDIDAIADRIGGRVSLFANIDPIGVLERASDAELESEIRRQAAAGRKARGFLISPASPITPGTSLGRVQRFIELARLIGTSGKTRR